MKTKKLLLLIFIVLVSMACILPAQIEVVDEEGETSTDEQSTNPLDADTIPYYELYQNEFDDIWAEFKTLILRESYEEAEAEAARLLTLKIERRINRLTFYSQVLSIEAYKIFKKTGKTDYSKRLFKLAQMLDPQLPDAYLLSSLMLFKSISGIPAAFEPLIRGTAANFTESFNRTTAISPLITLLLKAIIIAGVLFALVLLLRFGKLFRHDIELTSIFGIEDSIRKFSGLFFMLLPFVFWLGFEYIVLYLLVIFLPYCKPSSKFVGIIILIAVFLFIPWLKFNNAIIGTVNDKNVQFRAIGEESYYSDKMNDQATYQRKNSTESLLLDFIQAKILLSYGKYAEAYYAYRVMHRKNPNNADILINMGNVRAFIGRYDQAKVHYEDALERMPDNVYALYNLKLTIEQIDPFRDTSDYKAQIQSMDKEFGNSVFSDDGEKRDLIWIDFVTPERKKAIISTGIENQLKKQSGGTGSVLTLFMNPLSILSIIALLAFLIVNARWSKRGLAEYCQKCSRIYRPAKGTEEMEDKYCKQCVSIFFKKDGVAPNVQRQKILAISRQRKKEKTAKTLLSIFIPGSRQIYTGKGFTGYLILFKWVFLILVVIHAAPSISPLKVLHISPDVYQLLAIVFLVQTQITSIIGGLIKNAKGL